MESEREF
jgi:hypothetical protein